MGWLRNFIRARTKPIPKTRAVKARNVLSFAYYFSAWNLFILIVIYTIKYSFPENEDDKKHPSKYYNRVFGAGDARVIRFSGFTKVADFEIKGERRNAGTTLQERNEDDRKWQEYQATIHERRKREYRGLPEPAEDDDELLNEGRMSIEPESKNREDLNLLVEETGSL